MDKKYTRRGALVIALALIAGAGFSVLPCRAQTPGAGAEAVVSSAGVLVPQQENSEPQEETQSPQAKKNEDLFLHGKSQYVMAFFLLWFPALGMLWAAGIGFLGWKYAIQPTSGFAPLALFWLLVTAAGCFYLLETPFAMIGTAWRMYSANQKFMLYVLNFIGGAVHGFVLYYAFLTVKERLEKPNTKRPAGSIGKVTFPARYTLSTDALKTEKDFELASGQEGFPWRSAGVSAGSAAAGYAEDASVFFTESEMLFSMRQEGRFLFDAVKNTSVRFKDLVWKLCVRDDTVALQFVLNTGFLKNMTVDYAGAPQILPEPFDQFIAGVSGETKTAFDCLSRAEDLRWFESGAARGFLNSFSNERIAPLTLYSVLCRLLPVTCRWEQRDPPKFIECLPLLLVYETGMSVVAANNFIREGIMDEESFREQGGAVEYFSMLGYFSLKLWGNTVHLESLKALSLAAADWEKAADSGNFSSHIDTITPLWQSFARRVLSSQTEHSVKIAGEIYSKEQIDAVKQQTG